MLCTEYKDRLLKEFLEAHFDFQTLKKAGFFDKSIKKKDYHKQAGRICEFFGYKTIYQYGFERTAVHLSYQEGHRPKGEPFVLVEKAWHES